MCVCPLLFYYLFKWQTIFMTWFFIILREDFYDHIEIIIWKSKEEKEWHLDGSSLFFDIMPFEFECKTIVTHFEFFFILFALIYLLLHSIFLLFFALMIACLKSFVINQFEMRIRIHLIAHWFEIFIVSFDNLFVLFVDDFRFKTQE